MTFHQSRLADVAAQANTIVPIVLCGGAGTRLRAEAATPARVYRFRGWNQTMDLGQRFRMKRIVVTPGSKLSLQRHHHHAEHWLVLRRTAEVVRDDETLIVRENESIYVPLGCSHRLVNRGRIPAEAVEVQTGSHLEEDDIVRIEEDVARA